MKITGSAKANSLTMALYRESLSGAPVLIHASAGRKAWVTSRELCINGELYAAGTPANIESTGRAYTSDGTRLPDPYPKFLKRARKPRDPELAASTDFDPDLFL